MAITKVTNRVLDVNSVGVAQLSAGAVTEAKIANDAVTYAKIQNITTANRVLGSTTAGGAIGEVLINTNMIASNAITTAKIADGEVTFAKLALPSNFPIQIVQAVKTDVQTIDTGETNWVDVTGLSLTLVRRIPSASGGAVRIQAAICATSNDSNSSPAFRIVRGNTAIGLGDAEGSRLRATVTGGYGGTHTNPSFVIDFIDNLPVGSMPTITYKIQARIYSPRLAYINRSNTDANTDDYSYRTISTMTLTELVP